MLAKVIKLYRLDKSDDELIATALKLEDIAVQQSSWDASLSYLEEARFRYELLQNNKANHLLRHGLLAESLKYPYITNLQMYEQFSYAREIYEKIKNSCNPELLNSVNDALHSLALKSEYSARGYSHDTHQLMFLNFAKEIYYELKKYEDLQRLIDTAYELTEFYCDIDAQKRFLNFAFNIEDLPKLESIKNQSNADNSKSSNTNKRTTVSYIRIVK